MTLSRCLKSLAYKVLYNESSYSEWWYEDVCTLNLSQFKRLVEYLGAMHHDPVDISNVISYYGNKYNPGLDPNSTGVWIVEERKLLEEMVGLLPPHKGATSTEYLLSMLSAGIMLNANEKCIEKLEKTIGSQLDEAALHNVLASYSKNEQDAISEATNIAHIIYYYVAENLTSRTVKHREWLPF
jgi:NPH3 family